MLQTFTATSFLKYSRTLSGRFFRYEATSSFEFKLFADFSEVCCCIVQVGDELLLQSYLQPCIPRAVYDTIMKLPDASYLIDCLEERRKLKTAG